MDGAKKALNRWRELKAEEEAKKAYNDLEARALQAHRLCATCVQK